MPQQDVTINAWPDPLAITHRTDPDQTPQVDMNMTMRADKPVPVCFTLCEPICARSDYSIGLSIFDNPVVRIRVVGETRIAACGDKHDQPPRRPDCVDFATLKRGSKLNEKFQHDGAVIEAAHPIEVVDAGGTTGVRVPQGGLRVTFPTAVTGSTVRLLAANEAAVEGRSGDSLVTTVKVDGSPAIQQIDVPGLSLTTVSVEGEGTIVVEVCARRADELDRIF
ncbi:MAG TPA: hypothetical protein VES40_10975 [Ilumatobacteraceae bacterium]|nr:hypothetical protein [Ilumatobacteraceae bacterium]